MVNRELTAPATTKTLVRRLNAPGRVIPAGVAEISQFAPCSDGRPAPKDERTLPAPCLNCPWASRPCSVGALIRASVPGINFGVEKHRHEAGQGLYTPSEGG
jgi:hypothetical protein